MYQIDFYEKRNGISDVWDFLEELRLKSGSNKDVRKAKRLRLGNLPALKARKDYIRQQKE